jgi:thioredoxin reductase
VTYDCIIVGGGPAGLSAALMLGRSRRRVLLCDLGGQRNLPARRMHGYPTRDGTPPAEFLRMAREELGRYGTIECRELEIVDACREGDGFTVLGAGGIRLATRKLLLATGVTDELPDIPGLEALYGTSVHHCPYCDAWEWRDQPLAVYGGDEKGVGLALSLLSWSSDVLYCSGGLPLSRKAADRLSEWGIGVRNEPVLRLEGTDGRLERIVFAGGDPAPRSALFLSCGQHQRSPLADRLGCRFNEKGSVETGKCESTNVPGLYVAGDASKEAQFVIVAAAEGAEAGMAIHKALAEEALNQNNSSTPSRASRGGP